MADLHSPLQAAHGNGWPNGLYSGCQTIFCRTFSMRGQATFCWIFLRVLFQIIYHLSIHYACHPRTTVCGPKFGDLLYHVPNESLYQIANYAMTLKFEVHLNWCQSFLQHKQQTGCHQIIEETHPLCVGEWASEQMGGWVSGWVSESWKNRLEDALRTSPQDVKF